MNLESNLNKLIRKYKNLNSSLNEKDTENFFILPFLGYLGYDHSDPNRIKSRYAADPDYKKTWQVDYAILGENRKPIIFVECKRLREPLDSHYAQLKNYFNSSPLVKFALLTNGYEYRFYTDLDRENVLDKQPFLSFTLETDASKYLDCLSKFSRQNFDVVELRSFALKLLYRSKTLEYLKREINNPSDNLVKFITKNAVGETKKAVRDEIESFLPSIFEELSFGSKNTINNGADEGSEDDNEPIQLPAVSIFDSDNPTKKKLEYYIFNDKKHTGSVTNMFVTVFEYLFQKDKEQVLNIKGNPVRQFEPENLNSVPLMNGYFLVTNYSNADKFDKLKNALAKLDLKDILRVKLT
ncbi:MAG: type I restriction endonuclease [Bacteroidetes bacterium]|nr:type I restriction endonuclease [Bacteroidota bacterium]MCY4204693.1 type I restriction endonuclease [Bacteroidota bacterium]